MNDNERREHFEKLYSQHAGKVYRFALRLSGNRELAEDLAAEALSEAFRTLDRYRGASSEGSWLCAIVLNRWRMERRKLRVQTDPLKLAETLASTFRFEDVVLAHAIYSLSDPLREAFLLVKGEGLTHAEAAKVARVPVGTMYFRVHAAIRKLRLLLVPNAHPIPSGVEVTYDQEM